MQTKVSLKSNDLADILVSHLGKDMNLSRVKFLAHMIIALCKVQSVCFEKLALGFETQAQSSSNLRRIQRFMAAYTLDIDLITRLIFRLLPHDPPYILTMDRTNWKFGQTNINILVIGIAYDGLAFPLLYKLMPKRGNSSTQERIELVDRYIHLFGKHTIGELLADREFIGEDWLEYLNSKRIVYRLRIRNNFWVFDPRKQKSRKASWIFNSLELGQSKYLGKIYYVNNQLCYLSASKTKNKEGKHELLIIISFNQPKQSIDSYKQRWQIETAFKALKSSGFNLKDTHLTDIKRIEKLLTIVLIAFLWAYRVGIYIHQKIKPIRMLKHGNRAKSLFKYGLEYIAAILLNPYRIQNIKVEQFLSCT